MSGFARTDTSIVAQWWWTVDRWILVALGALIAFGLLLGMAASPAVAQRLDLDAYHFVWRHGLFVAPALAVLVLGSMLSPTGVRRIALVGLALSLVGTAATLIAGPEIKGATRWMIVAGVSLQPSELMKPCLIVVTAWLIAEARRHPALPGQWFSLGLLALALALLLAQPDFGMAAVVAAIWAAQIFLAGLAMPWVLALLAVAAAGCVAAYLSFPHISSRIDRFVDPAHGDNYQIETALQAFGQGGWLGRGPGQGELKRHLPDAHTDFIFAVAGEEFGLIVCLPLVALFAFVAWRMFVRLLRQQDLFAVLAGAGLVLMFLLQALINMGVNLDLLPTKGMTLPFISYGGSSLLSLAFAMGLLLAITRGGRAERAR